MEQDAIETTIQYLKDSKKTIVLTGPELSEESGLPDFASEEFNPNIRQFKENRKIREEYWKKVKEFYPILARATPNAAHEALAEMEMMGHLDTLFTQTTDGLHQRAGSNGVIELNSTMLWMVCTSCGKDYSTSTIQSELEKGADVPKCKSCGGDQMKPGISFPGQPPPHWELREAWMRLVGCEILLAVGASLDFHPGSTLLPVAIERGAKLIIISQRESPADDYAHAVIYGPPSQVMPHLVNRIKEDIGFS